MGVDSLPFDVFISILKQAISVESPEFAPTYCIYALHVVNAVCRHWRWTALNSPSLWAYIPSYLPPRLVQLYLQRSANAPLHVDLAYDDNDPYCGDPLRREDRFVTQLDNILPQSHRIRYLTLRVSASALKVYPELAHCRTPALEGLRFKSSTNYAWKTECTIFTTFRSPVLREIHFDRAVIIPYECIPVMSLSRLSLVVDDADIIVGEYLAGVLKVGVRLVFLSLDLWGTKFGDGEENIAPIPLPELRQLTMKGASKQCSSVYRMLLAPLLEEICLDSKAEHSDVETAAHLIPPMPAGDYVQIKVGDRTIRFEFTESRSLVRGTTKRFLFTLGTQYSRNLDVSNNHLLLGLLNSHHFAQITSFDFSTSSPFDLTFMPSLLSHFGTLQSLRVHFTDDLECILPIENTLSLSMLYLESPSPSTLRSLQRLVFRSFAVVTPQSIQFLVVLCTIVREREMTGLPSLVLEFKDCPGVTATLLRACGLNWIEADENARN